MIGKDKVAHFTVSFCIVMFLTLISEIFMPDVLALMFGVLMAFGIGYAKEELDSIKKGTFDKKDLVADLIGILSAVLVIAVI